MVCPECSKMQQHNKPIRGVLEVVAEREDVTPSSIFDFLPVEKEYFVDLPVGNTPLWRPTNLAKETGFKNLFIKDDTHNLTGSLKDRASLLVAAFAKRERINEVTVASTGNAGSSMAGIGAAANLSVTVFMPELVPQAKMIQTLQYGARVVLCAGNYDNAFDLSIEFAQEEKILSRNTAYNPLTIEGKKTVSLEIFHQLRQAPDFIFVPTGDGVILGGVYKGFKDLQKFGYIGKLPTIIAVQASGSDALYRAFNESDFTPVSANTIADSLSVSIPRNGYYALKQLQKYNGGCLLVSDDEILLAQKELSSKAGIFAEPAAAASYAGFLKMKDEISSNAIIILLVTGIGLKDINSAAKYVEFPNKAISSLEEI